MNSTTTRMGRRARCFAARAARTPSTSAPPALRTSIWRTANVRIFLGSNAACQKAAWKAYHQLNCSPLPLPLPAPKLEASEELDAEVDRLIELLRAVDASWKVRL